MAGYPGRGRGDKQLLHSLFFFSLSGAQPHDEGLERSGSPPKITLLQVQFERRCHNFSRFCSFEVLRPCDSRLDQEHQSRPTPESPTANTAKMGRLHSKGKGISSSVTPYSRTAPAWLKTTPEQVVEQICRLAKRGTTPSQIGVILRDSHGVAQVRVVTGKPTHPRDVHGARNSY